MSRPRGGDWLEDEIKSLKNDGVEIIVSLLQNDEISELDLTEEENICRANGIKYFSFPIPDRNVPSSKKEALNFAGMLVDFLKEGKSVVIHCRQGVGRSSLMTALVMILCGGSVNEIFQTIENKRGCIVPDTLEQREWVIHAAE